MKTTISPAYAEMNRQLHEEHWDYGGTAGARGVAQVIVDLARNNGLDVILDFGCGKGTLKPAIKALTPSLKVLEYDPAIKGKDRMPTRKPDLVAALDVMEHIEPDYLDAVLATLRDLQAKAVYLMIALTPANKTLPDGRNAHLIVEPAAWWLERLKPYFRTIFTNEIQDHLIFIGGAHDVQAQ